MFKKFTNGCVTLVQKFLPDAFIFCIILTILVFVAAIPAAGLNPIEVVDAWGTKMWSLLAFSMQMALVLVLGTAFATAPAIKKILKGLASIPKTPAGGIALVTAVSVIASFLQWGFGLVVGVIVAKEVAKAIPKTDYRLLVASGYMGFVVWHAGISGSIPLQVASWNETILAQTGNVVTESIPTSSTIFSIWNLIIIAVIFVVFVLVIPRMHPDEANTVCIDPKLLEEEEIVDKKAETPAEMLEHSIILSGFAALLGVVFLVMYFMNKGFNLSLDIVNLIFLTLGIIFHKTPINYVRAINDAAKGAGGVILQFPFYAGIMGLMTAVGTTGTSLAGVISDFFVSVSTKMTFPVFSFLAAGVVNFFVPSGGGQWAVQAPIMMPAGEALGVPQAVTAMAIAWGDAWTNLLQPFWALPALGIAGLGARDIMGYCVIGLIISGIIICVGFLTIVPMMAY